MKFKIPYFSIVFNRSWCAMMADKGIFGVFKNGPEVVPGRWGVYICFYYGVLEIGSRNPKDPVGIFLKKIGLWPF